jgi:hypothetical protein
MLKAVTVSRTYGNLPSYEVLKIVDYSHAEASCRNKQKLISKMRRRLEDDDDKDNLRAAIQRLRQRKEMERASLDTVVMYPPPRPRVNFILKVLFFFHCISTEKELRALRRRATRRRR